MRLLVYPHRMTIGGIQLIAIDLAAAMSERGHDVVVSSTPGPLVDVAKERGLRFIPMAVRGRFRPAPHAIAALRTIVRTERIDVVHAHNTHACLEAFYGARMMAGVPVVGSHMGMVPPIYIPQTVPLIVGTREIFEWARASRGGTVSLLEPPVDIDENHPAFDGSAFRRAQDVGPREHVVVIVSRLDFHMKLDSLRAAIDAVASLAPELPVRLFIVGDGEARDLLQKQADAVNGAAGNKIVTMTGWMLDPRPAYAAADVVVGMGSSVLRGMAFAKPSIVLGREGFCEVVAPGTIEGFLHGGFYGVGDGEPVSEQPTALLRALLLDAGKRERLARFSRELVRDRFSLQAAAAVLEEVYASAIEQRTARLSIILDGIRSGALVMRHKLGKRISSRVNRNGIAPFRARGSRSP